MVRNRYPLALIPPLAYLLVGLIIIITVIIRHKVARTKHRDSHLVASIANEDRSRSIPSCAFVSARLAPYPVQKDNRGTKWNTECLYPIDDDSLDRYFRLLKA